jgi:integrase
VFSLSPQLTERLRSFVEHRKADQPLFVTAKGRRLNPDNFVKRKLKPVLKALGLQGGCHAFRHGNATTLDGLNVPLKTRQERLGHVDPRTTLGYTHLVSADDRRTAEQLGKILCLNLPKMQNDLEAVNSQVIENL